MKTGARKPARPGESDERNQLSQSWAAAKLSLSARKTFVRSEAKTDGHETANHVRIRAGLGRTWLFFASNKQRHRLLTVGQTYDSTSTGRSSADLRSHEFRHQESVSDPMGGADHAAHLEVVCRCRGIQTIGIEVRFTSDCWMLGGGAIGRQGLRRPVERQDEKRWRLGMAN
jgi:hypothetical protein